MSTASEDAASIKHELYGPKGAFVYRDGDRKLAEMTHTGSGDTVIIDHTEVDDSLRGQGVGAKLVEAAVAWARAEGKQIIPLCPFAKATFEKRPDLADVLK